MKFERSAIRAKLRAQVRRHEPIILGGAGIGLVAKAADRAAMVDEMIAGVRKAWDERHTK